MAKIMEKEVSTKLDETQFSLEKEHIRVIVALNQTKILISLPQSKTLGVIGIDGKEYQVPTHEQLKEVFLHNEKLVDKKIKQGFTQLQLTPIAMPTSQLVDRVKNAILKHATEGKIIQTKQDPTNPDIPIRVNPNKPIWMWDRIYQTIDTSDVVYFSQNYTNRDHRGLTKEQVMKKEQLCAVPGWSVGLVEPAPIMPQQGKGKTIEGRKQLEAHCAPRDYLQTLSTPTYQGETGWTPEDFFTHFATQLEITNQVSHDRYDNNALWLLGSYIPNLGFGLGRVVPVGYWSRLRGCLDISAHRSGNRLRSWVARSIVRLGN